MKNILKFGVTVVALSLGLLCFISCQNANDSSDSTTTTTTTPTDGGGTDTGNDNDNTTGKDDEDTNDDNGEIVTFIELPASVGENPFVSEDNSTGVLLTVYEDDEKEKSYRKIEFNADGTAIWYYISKKGENEKIAEFKYSWNTETKNVYLLLTEIYAEYDGKLYTSKKAYFDAGKEAVRKWATEEYEEEYEEYKSETEASGEKPLSFDEWAKEEYGMTLEEYIEEIMEFAEEEEGYIFDVIVSFSYNLKDGKFVFTGVYAGFENLVFGDLRNLNGSGSENWYIKAYDLEYSKRDENNNSNYINIDYSRYSHDKTTITYKVGKRGKKDAAKLGLPEIIVANYTDDIANGICTINFTDPLNKKAISTL